MPGAHDRHQPLWLGSTHPVAGGTGHMVKSRPAQEHQLAGAPCSVFGPLALSAVGHKSTPVGSYGQRGHKDAHKLPGKHQILVSDVEGQEIGPLGKAAPLLLDDGAHIWGGQRAGDWLNQTAIDHAEWCLRPSLFRDLMDHYDIPVVDLFATPENT